MRACTVWLALSQQCGKKAVATVGGKGLAFCSDHTAILLASVEEETLPIIEFHILNPKEHMA